MIMEQTVLQAVSGPVYLGGPSANASWNIPLALKSLCGEIEAARLLIQAHEPLMQIRIAGEKEALTELGIATTCVVVTSFITERAIKTLIALTKPQTKPPQVHKLSDLFRRLCSVNQDKIQHQLEALPDYWSHYAETETVERILSIANDNFVDWRYVMEPNGATGGTPKPLLKVAVAVTLVGIRRLRGRAGRC